MRVRYTGPDAARDLACPGGCIHCPAGEWVDVNEALAAAGIDPAHGLPVVLGLAGQADWAVELDQPAKAKAAPAPDPEPAPEPVPAPEAAPDVKADIPADDPAVPDEETPR